MLFDLDARLNEWRKYLLDTTKRNRLIKFTTGRLGGISFLCPDPADVWSRLVREESTLTFAWKRDLLGLPPEIPDIESAATDFDPQSGTTATDADDVAREITELARRSPRLQRTHLLTELSDRVLAARLTRLYRNALEAERDHGVTTLFAAFGRLRWFENSDSTEELSSPLLLVPVRMYRDSVESPFTLATEDAELLPNHCLAEMLQAQFRIKLPSPQECPLDPENPECFANYLRAVAEKVKHIPRWGVGESAALGLFNFQKLAMWEDLGRNSQRIKSHPLCRAIAGDNAGSIAPPVDLPAAQDLDRLIHPEAVAQILDADSSQHEAIEAVKRGVHLVMDGPPGTGKSQTISNMIAECLAAGKTILFVSEKTAALDVVKKRLDRRGVGDFCLELHSAKANKKAVLSELGRCLELTQTTLPDIGERLKELGDTRSRLNEYVAELHAVRLPLGWSAFRVHGELARLACTTARSRILIKDVFTKDADYVRKCTDLIRSLVACRAVIEEPGGHPWRGCKITTYTHGIADEAKYTLTQLAVALTAVEAATDSLAGFGVGVHPITPRALAQTLTEGQCILSLPLFREAWFRGDPRTIADAVVVLDTAVRKVRDLEAKLPEFDLVAIRLATSVDPIWNPDRERLVLALPLHERIATLTRVRDNLLSLRDQVNRVEITVRELAGPLCIPTLPFGQIGELPAVAERIADSPAFPVSWWDTSRRAELFGVFSGLAEEQRAARSDQVRLASRILPAAFAPDSSAFAQAAADAAVSPWRWLPWSRWAKMKKQVLAWYFVNQSNEKLIRSDIATIARYHRRIESSREVAAAYANECFAGANSTADCEKTLIALRDVETLIQWKTTPELSRILCRPGVLDRTSLATAADRLSRETAAFAESWSSLLRDYVVPDRTAIMAMTPREVQSWLEMECVAIEKEITSLHKLAGLLDSGKDISPELLRERLDTVALVIAAYAQVKAAAGTLQDSRTLEELLSADHREEAEQARLLLGYLATRTNPVSPHLAQTLSNPKHRDAFRVTIDRISTTAIEFTRCWNRLHRELFEVCDRVSTSMILDQTAFRELRQWVEARCRDTERLAEWTEFLQVEKQLAASGLAAILDEVKAGEYPAINAVDAFQTRFYRLWLDALHSRVPALAAFNGDTHDSLVERFAYLDRLSVHFAPDVVRGRLITNSNRPKITIGAPEASELGILLREVNKKRRHIPLRDLFRQIPTILPRLKPCLMMSPLAVSTYLDSSELEFDVVIFDEASQVRPHDAICAVYRGKQLVVGGDPKQLPPTDFFNRGSDDSDDLEDTSSGMESLLDLCLALGLTRKRLSWHYRSRREELIAFSNRYFYDGRLVTFPSADESVNRAVTLVKVPDGKFKDGVNVAEARQVAKLVLEHARTQPERSLGVIAFSIRQQERILDELEILRRKNPETESFFDQERDDPFFVKNLENVQGDERDVVMISVGYGPDDNGKVAMRFGPLNRDGGERRLNVAVTRARSAMTVISSMIAADIDLSRTFAEGARLLRLFLDYADRGPSALAESLSESGRHATDSPFEQAVGDELVRRGLQIQRQFGCGGYLIDIAILDPSQTGKYILGVECDGLSYSAAATARDRERLRRAVLEGLGWHLVRVWSSDWVRDREKQVQRILSALQAAIENKHLRRDPDMEKLPTINLRLTKAKSQDFDNIEAVPSLVIEETILSVLTEYGAMPAEDLVTAAGRRLGFKRSGTKIKDRVTEMVNVLMCSNRLRVDNDGRVKPARL